MKQVLATWAFWIIVSSLIGALLVSCSKYGVSGYVEHAVGDWAQVRLPTDCKPKQVAAEEDNGVIVLCEEWESVSLMDMMQGLSDLSQKLRQPDGMASPETILLVNAQSMIGHQRVERSTAALERIATAVEQAAMYGWGSVRREDLGTD